MGLQRGPQKAAAAGMEVPRRSRSPLFRNSSAAVGLFVELHDVTRIRRAPLLEDTRRAMVVKELMGGKKMGWNQRTAFAISRAQSMRNRSGSDPANQIKRSWIVYDLLWDEST